MARLGLGVSGWFGRIQDEEVEDDVEEDVQVVKGLFIKFWEKSYCLKSIEFEGGSGLAKRGEEKGEV